MYKANYGNNIRRKDNSDIYKYRCEAREALGRRPLRPPPSPPVIPVKSISYPFRLKEKFSKYSTFHEASSVMYNVRIIFCDGIKCQKKHEVEQLHMLSMTPKPRDGLACWYDEGVRKINLNFLPLLAWRRCGREYRKEMKPPPRLLVTDEKKSWFGLVVWC
jgi:hypothetical protein